MNNKALMFVAQGLMGSDNFVDALALVLQNSELCDFLCNPEVPHIDKEDVYKECFSESRQKNWGKTITKVIDYSVEFDPYRFYYKVVVHLQYLTYANKPDASPYECHSEKSEAYSYPHYFECTLDYRV